MFYRLHPVGLIVVIVGFTGVAHGGSEADYVVCASGDPGPPPKVLKFAGSKVIGDETPLSADVSACNAAHAPMSGDYGFSPHTIINACSKLIDDVMLPKNEKARLLAFRGRAYGRLDDRADWDRGIADCTEAIQLDPAHGAAYAWRGAIHMNKEAYAEAIADFTSAIERNYLNDDFQTASYLRGLAYSFAGNKEAAIADLRKALAVDWPPNKNIEALLKCWTAP